MDIYETRWFKKWVDKKGLLYTDLVEAVVRIDNGLGTVDLGSGLYKVRIAKQGQGRSGGYRTILIYRENKRAMFIYGFEKNDIDNIDKATLNDYKRYAKTFLEFSESEISKLVANGTIFQMEEK